MAIDTGAGPYKMASHVQENTIWMTQDEILSMFHDNDCLIASHLDAESHDSIARLLDDGYADFIGEEIFFRRGLPIERYRLFKLTKLGAMKKKERKLERRKKMPHWHWGGTVSGLVGTGVREAGRIEY